MENQLVRKTGMLKENLNKFKNKIANKAKKSNITAADVQKHLVVGVILGIGIMTGLVIGVSASQSSVKAAALQNKQEIAKITSYYEYKISENEAYKMLYSDSEKQIQTLTAKSTNLEDQMEYLNQNVAVSKDEHSKLMATEDVSEQKLNANYIVTAKELNAWIARVAPKDSPFKGQGTMFIKASQESGLNPYYIVAHAALESAWGTSKISKEKHNYFGIGAYNASPGQSAYSFDSMSDGIISGADWIAKNYTDKGQDTLHSMIYGPKAYCQYDDGTPSQTWIDQVSTIMRSSK